jgi:hypothetical protein
MQAIRELKHGQRNTYIKAKQEKVKCPVDDPMRKLKEGNKSVCFRSSMNRRSLPWEDYPGARNTNAR